MQQKCIFSISDIDSGWFDMEFKTEEETAYISASYVLEASPKELLILLTDLMTEKIDTGYVLFYHEPGTDIVSLEKGILTVAYSRCDYIYIDTKGFDIPLRGTMTFNEISNIIDIKTIDLQAEIDVKVFIQSVYKSFSKYAHNHLLYDKYEENWDMFPQKEWDIFEQAIKQKGWDKKDF